MAEAKSNTPDQHLELAAFHLYESGREHDPERPAWDSDEALSHRTDCRYRIRAAQRRGIASVNLMVVERLASAFAVADGEIWPLCERAINPNLPEAQKLAIAAQRRQRYRHVARIAVSESQNFYELGTESEASRIEALERAQAQLSADKAASAAWRGQIGLPSAVPQLPKDGE